MKKLLRLFLLLLPGYLLFNTIAFAQLGERIQRGRATQEMNAEGLSAAHFNIPLDSTVRVTNTENQKEIKAKIIGRIPASSGRIIDLSPEAYNALELKNTTIVMVTYSPPALHGPETQNKQNNSEMPRLNTTLPVFNLLILDREHCVPDADIEDTDSISILYNFKHDKNKFLIALYVSDNNGTVFPKMPDNSLIVVNMTTINRNAIIDYLNSNEFGRYVTNQSIITDLRRAIDNFRYQ